VRNNETNGQATNITCLWQKTLTIPSTKAFSLDSTINMTQAGLSTKHQFKEEHLHDNVFSIAMSRRFEFYFTS
jgi:hypothetical protein